MSAVAEARYSAADLLKLPDRDRFELVNGELLENGTQVAKGKQRINAISCERAASTLFSGSQATHNKDQGSSAFNILTAACLSSGCLELGQKAEVVSAFTPANGVPVLEQPLKYSSPQCIAMKAWLMPTSLLACSGTTMEPRLLVT